MYKETEKKINNIMNKYGEFYFNAAVDFLKTYGYANVDKKFILSKKVEFAEENKKTISEGKTPLIDTNVYSRILDAAYELSLIDMSLLAFYIQENIHYNVEQSTLPKQRLLVLLKNALTIIYEDIDNPICFIETLSSECEFTDDEIESLGYESLLDDYYNLCENDDGMV